MTDSADQNKNVGHAMEILAPAGDAQALQAALAAGCDAVYLGLQNLNARRGAKNFSAEELPGVVAEAHARGVRVYLTLNIDVAQRELGQGARMLKLAEDAGVDAVLVRDPAVMSLCRLFPRLEMHFSTQSCIANSADVLAAGELGASRVVLARELSLKEIAACSKVGKTARVETEVFVQGALCFCISGRCLLSSWVGGHSGNRGTCTSPCRVPWMAGTQALGTPLAMKDLSAVSRIGDLLRAGVKSLKIEGRLKSAKWVGQAVGIFKQALEGGAKATEENLLTQAQGLGAYAGRQLTWDYLDGKYDNLVAQGAGRSSAPVQNVDSSAKSAGDEDEEATGQTIYDLSLDVTDQALVCTCRIGQRSTQWTLPKTVVRRENKAVPISDSLGQFERLVLRDCQLGNATSNNPDYLMVPRAANALIDQVSDALRQLLKTQDTTLRLDIPDVVRSALTPLPRHEANTRLLGDSPNCARVEARHVVEFIRRVKAAGRAGGLPQTIIVEQTMPDQIGKLLVASAALPLVIALPSVFFENEIPQMQTLIAQAVACGLAVEVNSWGGWKLARDLGATIEAGPGLGVLNNLAAKMLFDQGCRSVSIAVEADRQQMEDLTGSCSVPCSLTVYGRPALMVTRVHLPKDKVMGSTLQDRRGVQVRARQEQGLWTLRPVLPFDLRNVRNKAIAVANLVVDLVGSATPAEEWLRRPLPGEKTPRFNYGRTLA